MVGYFLRGSRIEDLAPLKSGPDNDLIREAKLLFTARAPRFDGFEVWDGQRFVYGSDQRAEKSTPSA